VVEEQEREARREEVKSRPWRKQRRMRQRRRLLRRDAEKGAGVRDLVGDDREQCGDVWGLCGSGTGEPVIDPEAARELMTCWMRCM